MPTTNSTNQPTSLIWVQGNKLQLALPLQIVTFTDDGKTEEDYNPPTGSTILVCLAGKFRCFRYTPTISDGNVLHIVDNGELPADSYSVTIIVEEPNGTKRRCKWNYVINVYDSNEKVTDYFDDFPDWGSGSILEGSVFYSTGSGGYEPPVGGIPKSDLASDVQASLSKADTAIQDISGKQDVLVSGTNIKTINNESILGNGNITIEGGGAVNSVNGKTGVVVLDAEDVGAATAAQGAKADTALQPSDVDSAMSDTSENPVQNKVVKDAIDDKLSEVIINSIPAGSIAIINNLTTGGETFALSAEMGKLIRQNVQTILDALGEYAFPNGKPEISWTPKPYDAVVEYLESTGTQWINTSFAPNQDNFRLQMSLEKTATKDNVACQITRDGYSLFFQMDWYNQTMYYRYCGTENTYTATNGKHLFELGPQILQDGVVVVTPTPQSSFEGNTDILSLLAKYNGSNKFKGKIYFAKGYYGNTLIFDLIPVRLGTTGYLYDRVSGEMFGNSGTGDFILGNDVQS